MKVVRKSYSERSEDNVPHPFHNGNDLRPHFWRFLQKGMKRFDGDQEFTARRYLLVLAVLLPLNVLFFFTEVGLPVYTPVLENRPADVAALLASWPRGGGLVVDEASWRVTSLDGTVDLMITTNSCYKPGTSGYALLVKLRQEPNPKQAYCEARFGSMLASLGKDYSKRSWQQDDDVWDELFEFLTRLYGALAGIVANRTLERAGGGFLEDMTDLFDMYFFSFADIAQLPEGRPLVSRMYGAIQWVLGLAYISMFLRALANMGFTPVSNLLLAVDYLLATRYTEGMRKEDITKKVQAGSSLVFIEIPFIIIRAVAWYEYGVPVSVLAVKNVLGIYADLRTFNMCTTVAEESNTPTGSRPSRSNSRGFKFLFFTFQWDTSSR